MKPRIIVTIPLSSLLGSTGHGLTHDGGQISPTLTRALGCDAEFLAAILDSDGNLLDCGRLNRLFTGKTRLALELRDRGCAWPGCARPISWTQAHHIVSWLDGGETKPSNGVRPVPVSPPGDREGRVGGRDPRPPRLVSATEMDRPHPALAPQPPASPHHLNANE